MSTTWRTAWQGQDIVVFRDEVEVDRVNAGQIQRVVFVYAGAGESPGDPRYAIVETESDCIVFPPETGFAGRVSFERVDYWAQRACVYWVPQARATLPMRFRRGRFWLRFSGAPTYSRAPRAELSPLVDCWPLEGPQTWEQRKWRRIERGRPFGSQDDAADKVRA